MTHYHYQCFGDVLAFNATYKSNEYQKPLFGFALLVDEIVDLYIWLL